MNNPVSHLEGAVLDRVELDAEARVWFFIFHGGMTLQAEAPWRIVAEARVVLGGQDHGQVFGLPKAVDASECVAAQIIDSEVTHAEPDPTTGDLRLRFMNGAQLQVFTTSGGYEAWQLNGPGSRTVVCHSGGTVSTLE